MFFEFNASDERGINVIRSKIKNLSMTSATIVLDECDTLTVDAQHSLRRIVECSKARFVFITNYLSKIIPPLRSRLLKVRFELEGGCYRRLVVVGSREGLKLCEDEYKKVFEFCNRDLRKAINFLQMARPLILAHKKKRIDNRDEKNGQKDKNNNDDKDNNDHDYNNDHGYKIDLEKFGMIPEKVITDFLNLKDDGVAAFVDNFVKNSYSLSQFIQQIEMDVSDVEGLIYKGCDTEIVLHYLCYSRNGRCKF